MLPILGLATGTLSRAVLGGVFGIMGDFITAGNVLGSDTISQSNCR